MRHFKILGVMLVAMFSLGVTALGMTATSAFALPDISLLSGEAFPLDLHFADNSKTPTQLETSAGGLLEGKGVEILLELTALSALGAFSSDFLNVVEAGGTTKCNSTGDAAGVVLVTGEWHLVPITTTPLVNGIAFLLGSLVIVTCGTKKIDIKGCALAKTSLTETQDLTEAQGELGTTGTGKNLQREYLNDKAEDVLCTLTTEVVGTGTKREGAEGVNEGKPVGLTIPSGSSAKMFFATGL